MKGMIFTAENVKAIREGRKTVTRRIEAGLKGINEAPDMWRLVYKELETFYFEPLDHRCIAKMVKPRYHIGETVYVKETWAMVYDDWPLWEDGRTPFHIEYKADTGDTYPGKWPSEYKDDEACGRWKSPLSLAEQDARTFLQIVSVRLERLQGITIQDVVKEGIAPCSYSLNWVATTIWHYAAEWDRIHGPGAWDANLWVPRYEFKKVGRPE